MAGVAGRRTRAQRGLGRVLAGLTAAFVGASLLVGVPITPAQAEEQAHSLDASFGTAGVVTTGFSEGARAVAVQADGKPVTGGTTVPTSGDGYEAAVFRFGAVARHNTDGTLDTTFGDDGVVELYSFMGVTDVAVQPDGGILAVGFGSGRVDLDIRIARLRSDGSLDPAFGDSGIASLDYGGYEWGNGIALNPTNGTIAVAGGMNPGTGSFLGLVALLDVNGAQVVGFGGVEATAYFHSSPHGDVDFAEVAFDPSGNIVAAGSYVDLVSDSLDTQGVIARLTPAGALDPSFARDGDVIDGFWGMDDPFEAVLADPQGRVVVVGNAYTASDLATRAPSVRRYTSSGVADTTFAGDGRSAMGGATNHALHDLALTSDGRIVGVGREWPSADGNQARSYVWFINDDGQSEGFFYPDLDPSSDGGGNEGLTSGAIAPSGALVAAGKVLASSTDSLDTDEGRFLLARFQAPTRPTVEAQERIAFGSDRGNADNDFDIWVANPDGTGLRNLTSSVGVDDTDPSLSPDGTKVVFVSQRPSPELYVIDLATGTERQLTRDGSFNADPAWSPDGSRIAFTSFRNGDPDVFTIAADRAEDIELNPARNLSRAGDGPWDSFPTWSPDGRVVFQSDRAGNFDIWAVDDSGDPAALTPTQLTTASGRDEVPAVSPDGRKLLFTRIPAGATFGGDLHTVAMTGENVDTPAESLLGSTTTQDSSGTFSPDGSKVLFGRETGAPSTGTSDLMVVDLNAEGYSAASLGVSGRWSQGASWAGSLSVTTDAAAVAASPTQVALRDIPLQPQAPSMQTAPLEFPPLAAPLEFPPLAAPLEFPPLAAPLEFPPLAAPVDQLPLLVPLEFPPLAAPLEFPPLAAPLEFPPLAAPLEFPPLAAPDGSSLGEMVPAAQEALKHIPFTSIVITQAAGGHAGVIAGTQLSTRPLQDLSLYDVLADPVAGPRLRRLQLHELSVANSPLRDLGLGLILLRETKLSAIGGINWCAILSGLGWTDAACGGAKLTPPGAASALDATLLDLKVAGVPFNDPNHPIDLYLTRLGEISFGPDTPLPYARIGFERLLRETVMGSVKLNQIASSALNAADRPVLQNTGCQDHSCIPAGATLWSVFSNTTDGIDVNPDAPMSAVIPALSDITVGQIVFGLAGIDAFPYEEYPVDQLGILSYAEKGRSSAVWHSIRWNALEAAQPRVSLLLGRNASPVPQYSYLTVDGSRLSITPSIAHTDQGVEVSWQLPGVVTGVVEAFIDVRPGVRIGHFAPQARVLIGGGYLSAVGAPYEVTENWEPNDSPAAALDLSEGELYIAHAPDGHDYWRFPAPAEGTIVDVYLGNRAGGDNDLVVYYPDGTQGVGDNARLRAAAASTARVQPLADGGVDQSSLGEPLAAETRNDLPIADLPVAGLSDHRSRANEVIRFISLGPASTVDAPRYYTVQVSPYLREASYGPYTLRVKTRQAAPLPACPASLPAPVWGTSQGTPVTATTKSLFLVNESLLRQSYPAAEVDTLLTDLKASHFLDHPKVQGAVVALDTDVAVRDAYDTWHKNPCDVLANNAVVRAINDHVDAVLATSGAMIENIVVVGGPEVVPQALIPDATQVGNELLFGYELQPLFGATGNRLTATGSNVRTDDPYGDFDPEPYGSRFLYKPDVALGRLLETPAEMRAPIIAMVGDGTSTNTGHGGVIPIDASYSAGGYFMKDLATEIDAALAQKVDAANRTLVANDLWTRGDLNAVIAGTQTADGSTTPAPNVIAVNTHANPFALGPPGSEADPFLASELNAAKTRLGLSVLLSIGCHSATSVYDGYSATQLVDFAQTVAGGGGTFVGQTGYGLGLEGALAFSEEVLTEVANGLGGMTIGQALALAKNNYLAQGVSSPYAEKSAAEAILVGLPMVTLGAPAALTPSQSEAVASGTDAASGFETASVSASPHLAPVQTDRGVYYEADDGTHAVQYRPVGARVDLDVTHPTDPSKRATGVFLTGRQQSVAGSETTPIDPVFAAPALSGAAATPAEPQFDDVIYPAVPHGLVRSRAADGVRDVLSLNPTQFRSLATVAGKGVGQFILDNQLEATVFYGNVTPGHTDPPVIDHVEAAEIGNVVSFLVRAHDPDGGAITKASVLFADATGWHYLELSPAGTPGVFTGAAAFSGTEPVDYIAQVLDDEGMHGISSNKGRNFRAMQVPPTPEGVTATVVDSTATNGWYAPGAKVQLEGEGLTFEYRLDGGDWQPYTGPVPVSGDGFHSLGYRTSDNRVGVVAVPIDGMAPTVTITSPAAGATYEEPPIADFSCADTVGVASCTAVTAEGSTVTNGSPVPVVPDTNTVTVTAVDLAGKTTTSSVTFTYKYIDFEGYLSPITNGITNEAKAGRTVPAKWRLRDQTGALVRDLPVVSITAGQSPWCPGDTTEMPTEIELTVEELDTSSLKYDLTNEQYVYNWKTSSAWRGCYVLRVTIEGGGVHDAFFSLR